MLVHEDLLNQTDLRAFVFGKLGELRQLLGDEIYQQVLSSVDPVILQMLEGT